MMFRVFTTLSLCLFVLAGYSQFETVGIIGDATPNGWGESTPMNQDDEDPNLWTLEVDLVDGFAKFRADNSWDVNWGDNTFPVGVGEQDGADIPVTAGSYLVTFNSESGSYFFDLQGSNIGVIGSATPFGWDREVFMFQDPEDENQYSVTLDLVQGDAKFRADGGWDLNWGGDDFPEGTAVEGGNDISIPNAGTYVITFNTETLFYSFDEQADFETIGLIGEATPGGWDEDTPLNRDPNNPAVWSAEVELTEGACKFRADNDWAVNWGGDDFPIGDAISGGDDIIVDEAGTYLVFLDTENLVYQFVLIVEYDQMGIIGSGTPGGWVELTDLQRDANDVSVWRGRAELTTGDLLFATDASLQIAWGGSDFPSGTAVPDASLPIPVEEGDYLITFNSTLGSYNFEAVVEYDEMSLVGESGPFGRWPDETTDFDFFLDKDPDDFNLWTGNNIELNDFDATPDGGVKFRANGNWDVNWGDVDFPEGVGINNGPNIEPEAGTYSVVFNSLSGEYAFGPTVSTREEMLNPAYISLMPNPAVSEVLIDIDFEYFTGALNVAIFDVSGKQVFNQNYDDYSDIRINVSAFTAGTYIVQLRNGQYFTAKQLSVVK